jgi:hypothetical protein
MNELIRRGIAYANRAASSLTQDELAEAYRCGLEPGPDDRMVGRDPGKMSLDELRALNHGPLSDAELCDLAALFQPPGRA